MSFSMMLLLLLLLLSLAPVNLASDAPTFAKCCPKDETLSFATSKCIRLQQQDNLTSLQPPFASTSDPNHESEIPPFRMGETQMPDCSSKEGLQMRVLLNPGNEVTSTSFLIDDMNLTDTRYSLIDLPEADQYKDYCLDTIHREDGQFVGTVGVVCSVTDEYACKTRPCVSFCCPIGHYYDTVINDCELDPNETFPHLHFFDKEGNPVKVSSKSLKVFNDMVPKCKHHSYGSDQFHLLDSGLLDAGGGVQNYTEYCLERYGTLINATTIDTSSFTLKALVCAPADPFSQGYLRYIEIVDLTLVPSLFVVSLVFLGLLFAFVYVRNRHKLFGVMTLCLISMLFLFYVVLIIAKFSGETLVKQYKQTCVAIGLLLQFFYLSAMFWLNAMSFDIWSAFRQMRKLPEQSGHKLQGWRHKRFKWYALYAWSCPMVVVLVTVLMQFLPESVTSGATVPDIGHQRCFLDSKWAMIYYLNIIIGPICCLNIFFFFSSTWNLLCGIWADKTGDPVMKAQDRTRYKTVIKMFFAMGVTWLAEAVSHALDWAYGPKEFRYAITVFKIINSLQGLILFVVIVFDQAMVKWLREKLLGAPTPRSKKSSVASTRVSSSTTSNGRANSATKKFSNILAPPEKHKNNTKAQQFEMLRSASPPPPREI